MNTQTLKGFRDFLPDSMAVRNRVISTLKQVFESYGFAELQTPTLEYAEVLKGKYGEEAEKLMYIFKDPGGREVGLKYDLTVPLARVISQFPNIQYPFKRYQIQPAFRAENTQKGRYREFYQCDIDTVGSSSPLSDAEILAVISDSLTALRFTNFTIRINSRQVLFDLLAQANIPEEKNLTVIQSLDKLDKKSKQEVTQELISKQIDQSQVENLFSLLDSSQPDSWLQKVIDLSQSLGAKNIKFDPTMARGLDYYTGAIFETVVTEPRIGSITGGGRYDNLIKTLGGPDLPAVGTTIGLDRIVDVISDLQLWKGIPLTPTKILVTVFSPELLEASLKLSLNLRQSNISSELYPYTDEKLDKQIKYAAQKGIPYVAILGPEEINNNSVTIKNLKTSTQQIVKQSEVVNFFVD